MQHAFGDRADKTISLYTFASDILDSKNSWEEARIDLGLTKRVIVYLTPEKFHTYEPPSDKLIKVVVQGDDASVKAASKLEKVKELRKKGIKVIFKAKKSDTSVITKGPSLRMRYKDRLYTEICKDPKQLEWFHKFFK